MLEFLGCFPSISGPPPTIMAELADGVVLFEALSEIAPDHFEPATISREVGDNWALKSSNLRKLVRNLETFFNDVLKKDADFEKLGSSISSVARDSDTAAIVTFIELIIAAACTCGDRETYIGWIMNMGDTNKSHMKAIIESSLSQISNCDDGSAEVSDDEEYDSGPGGTDDFSYGEDKSFEGGESMTGLFRNAMDDMDAVTSDMGIASGGKMDAVVKENEELRLTVEQTKREFAALKLQSVRYAEDTETSQKKASLLSQDLQERLEIRENELTGVEEELIRTKRALIDAEERSLDLTEKNTTMADELDIATAKANQLRKSEATVVAYRKKLEGVGVMNQQMTELEDTAAGYLKQIMDLEIETKKVPELLKTLEKTKRKLEKTDKECVEAQEAMRNKSAEVSKIKADLSACNRAKRSIEEEFDDLRTSMQSPEPILADVVTSAPGNMEMKEKIVRLEHECKTLKSEIRSANVAKKWKSSVAAITSQNASADATQLRELLEQKEMELKKLASDKDRLETYTKKTLAKFQEKYLVALQECKAKLKEKHDKIETLEKRSAAEKSTQKREEKLLSATIYELGLSIMQQNLKER